MSRLAYGFGENDLKIPIRSGKVLLKSYEVWRSMIRRCYGEKELLRNPTYKGCSVTKEWELLSNFKSWYDEQSPPNGWSLDKDLLVKDNKVYCKEYCIFVEKSLNSFLTQGNQMNSNLPVGVHFDKSTEKYAAQGSDVHSGKRVWLGLYDTPFQAEQVYNTFKSTQVRVWIKRIKISSDYKRKDEIIKSLLNRYPI